MTGSGVETGIGSAWLAGSDRDSPWRQPPMLLATLSVVVLAVLVIVTLGATRTLERQAAEQAGRLAQNAVAELWRRDAELALDYAWWNETFARLHGPRPDLVWAEENLGRWLSGQFAVSGSFVARRDRGWIYGSLRGRRLEAPEVAALLGEGGEALVREAALSPFDAPETIARFLAVDGGVALATAVAVTPEDRGDWALEPTERPVLLLLRAFDEALLSSLADIYGLEGLRLHAEPVARAIPLRNEEMPVAWLAWDPPGYATANLVLLVQPVAGGLLLLLAAAAVLAWRAQRGLQQRARRDCVERRARCRPRGLPSVFLANVSHELRTPLNAILGFSEILRDQQAGAAGQYRQYAADIHASGRRLLGMIDDIVELSRIQAGLVHSRPATVGLVPLLRRLEAALAEERPAEVGRLVLDLSRDVRVAVDPEIALQLLSRLVGHCLDEADDPVAIEVGSPREGRLRLRLGESRLSPEVVRRSFEPFGSSGNPLVSGGGGGGVDLALAHALAALVGGGLEVEEGEKGGSRFLLDLPTDPAADAARLSETASALERPAALS